MILAGIGVGDVPDEEVASGPEHSQTPRFPLDRQDCDPCLPSEQTQATLAPS